MAWSPLGGGWLASGGSSGRKINLNLRDESRSFRAVLDQIAGDYGVPHRDGAGMAAQASQPHHPHRRVQSSRTHPRVNKSRRNRAFARELVPPIRRSTSRADAVMRTDK